MRSRRGWRREEAIGAEPAVDDVEREGLALRAELDAGAAAQWRPARADRPPFPLPRNVETPAYFTIQPGAGYVYNATGAGARIVYPNFAGPQSQAARHALHFLALRPEEKGWHVYGLDTVTETGGLVMPDPKVEVYGRPRPPW